MSNPLPVERKPGPNRRSTVQRLSWCFVLLLLLLLLLLLQLHSELVTCRHRTRVLREGLGSRLSYGACSGRCWSEKCKQMTDAGPILGNRIYTLNTPLMDRGLKKFPAVLGLASSSDGGAREKIAACSESAIPQKPARTPNDLLRFIGPPKREAREGEPRRVASRRSIKYTKQQHAEEPHSHFPLDTRFKPLPVAVVMITEHRAPRWGAREQTRKERSRARARLPRCC